MKTKIIIITIFALIEFGYAQNSSQNSHVQISANTLKEDDFVLEFYRRYSPFTDPGEYGYLYENLPNSLPALCSMIKSQIIHPFSELPKLRDKIPQERWNEYFNYPTVQSILEGLVSHDSSGFNSERKAEDKLILGCNQNAILLASILKYRGIPARVRAGHAAYIMPGFHVSHTICEVWNNDEKRWILVDPSMDMVDFSRDKFDISNELWFQMQKGEIDPDLYGIPRRYTGLVSIVGKVCTDLASLLGTEYPINQYAPILDNIFKNNQLTNEQIELLNNICELMNSNDAENLVKLREIYYSSPQIQITKVFSLEGKK